MGHPDGCWRQAWCPTHRNDSTTNCCYRDEPSKLAGREIILYKPRWGTFFGLSIYEASDRDSRVVLVEDAVSGLYERGRAEISNSGVRLLHADSVIARLDGAQQTRYSP